MTFHEAGASSMRSLRPSTVTPFSAAGFTRSGAALLFTALRSSSRSSSACATRKLAETARVDWHRHRLAKVAIESKQAEAATVAATAASFR